MERCSFVQAGYVVPDLSSAMQAWLHTANIGPFFVMRHLRFADGRYRGAVTGLEMSIAFAQAGPLQIELIEQHSDGPSAYREVYPQGAGGFHHLCYFVDDLRHETERLAAENVEMAYIARYGDLNFAYFDTRASLGCFTEVLERDPTTVTLFRTIADAAIGWDGRDPIRHLGE